MTADHVFNQIVEEFREDRIPGWCTVEKAIDLAATILALRPQIIVEIGVFGGKSLLPMALMCEFLKVGKVIGIDPWSQQASSDGYTGENANWWGKLDHTAIYNGFVENLRRLNLGPDRVEVLRAKSDDVLISLELDVLHIDGQHTAQAIRDVAHFAPLVRVGGIVCMDDTNWVNDGVAHVSVAVKALKKLGFIELYPSGTGAFFQRTK